MPAFSPCKPVPLAPPPSSCIQTNHDRKGLPSTRSSNPVLRNPEGIRNQAQPRHMYLRTYDRPNETNKSNRGRESAQQLGLATQLLPNEAIQQVTRPDHRSDGSNNFPSYTQNKSRLGDLQATWSGGGE